MLQSLENIGVVPAPIPCEACGKQVARRDEAINIIIVVGSPGHPALPPFQCPQEEHWACSLECWLLVAHACIDEHIHTLLRQAHASVGKESS